MGYLPIGEHGVIGNLRTAALVGVDGTIDWMCFPHFDSPSVFGALLDDKKGGSFSIAPVGKATTTKQFYWSDTNVLVTRFFVDDGIAEIADFMPIGIKTEDLGEHVLVRRLRAVRGNVRFRMTCRPAFDYARAPHTVTLGDGCATFASEKLTLALVTPHPLTRIEGEGVTCEIELEEGQDAVFILGGHLPEVRCPKAMATRAEELFRATVTYWRTWLAQSTYIGRWRETVHRSALALKLMTFEPTGAIVASPTTSLPEVIGGVRNWDYRFSWIRDAAFTIYGLIRIGFTGEAHGFIDWLGGVFKQAEDGTLQVVYSLDGKSDLTETVLDHLDGYAGSRPVRIGNDASKQLQLDIYGELLDAIYLWNKYGLPVTYDTWVALRKTLDWLCDNWQQPDDGIWEVRGQRQNFVYSRMMCWVALDRGLRLAHKRSFPCDHLRWLKTRDIIYEEIMHQGFDAELQSFVQSYGSKALDASALLMPLVFFMSPTDPRMLATIRAINKPPSQGGLRSDGLVYRYDSGTGVDGVAGSEGTFNLCSFWLVEAMTRAGRADPELLDEARLLFERILGYANHVGLYSEQIGQNGEALGNFPQAFTHLALISAAYNLDRALDRR